MTSFNIRKNIKRFFRKLNAIQGICGYDADTGTYFYYPLKHVTSFQFLSSDKILFRLTGGSTVTFSMTPNNKGDVIQGLHDYFQMNPFTIYANGLNRVYSITDPDDVVPE